MPSFSVNSKQIGGIAKAYLSSSSSTMADVNSATQSSEQPNKMVENVANQNPLPNTPKNVSDKGEFQSKFLVLFFILCFTDKCW